MRGKYGNELLSEKKHNILNPIWVFWKPVFSSDVPFISWEKLVQQVLSAVHKFIFIYLLKTKGHLQKLS